MKPEGRVLVTGAGGQVGGCLVRTLREKGVAARPFSRRPLPMEDLVLGDLLSPQTLDAAVRDVEVVIHCAAHLGEREEEIIPVNVEGTRALLSRAASAGVRRFVFVSSVAVYGEGDLLDTGEDRPVDPRTPYAQSKAEGERMLAESSGIEWVVLRPCTVYGPGEKRFLPLFVQALQAGSVPLVRDGKALFDLVHVDDLCQALWRAATMDAAPGGLFNVAEGVPRTILSVLQFMAMTLDVTLNTVPPEAVPGIDPSLVKTLGEHRHFNIERARSKLGYKPAVSLEDGLQAILVEGAL